MAREKIKTEKIDKNFDIDSELDFGDFDFEPPTEQDDRKPITKLATGFLQGAKEGIQQSSFLKKTIKDIFPPGFGKTIDFSDKVTQNVRSLYDESAREIRPAIKDAKRIAAKLIPKDSNKVPKFLKDLAKKWEAEQEEYQQETKDSRRETFLGNQLADLFQAQISEDIKSKAEDTALDRLEQGLAVKRHRDLYGILNLSNQSLTSLVNYQSGINLPFQKKSLELGYRQLFTLQDLLEESKKSFALQTTSYEKIVKNTALPDFVKINEKEFREQVFKNKFYEGIQRGLFGGQNDIVEKTFAHLRKEGLEKVKNGIASFRQAASGIELASDQFSGPGGPDSLETGGNIGGTLASQGLGGFLGGVLKKNVLDKSPKLKAFGTKLDSKIEDLPRSINEFRKSSDYAYDDSIKGYGVRFLQSLIPNFSPDKEVDQQKITDLEQPYVLTKRTDKSINEVIPGYLSRILREVQVFRTGNEKIELTEYDINSNKFTSKSKSIINIFKTLVPQKSRQKSEKEINEELKKRDPRNRLSKAQREKLIEQIKVDKSVGRTQGQLDSIIKDLDPNAELSAEEIKDLKKVLLKNSSNLNKGNEKNLSGRGVFQPENQDKLNSVIKNFFDTANADKKLEFSQKHNQLSEDIHDPRQQIQSLINLGKTQDLKKLDLLSKDGKTVNIDKLLEYYLGEQPDLRNKSKSKKKVKLGDQKPFDPREEEIPDVLESKSIKEIIKGSVTKVKSFAGKTLNNATAIADKAVDTASNAGEGIKDTITKVNTFAKDTKQTFATKESTAQAFKDTLDKAIELVRKGKDIVLDLYIKGQETAKITVTKVKEGKYIDKMTQKVVKEIKDITGPILDENNNEVVSSEEVSKLTFFNAKTKAFEAITTLLKYANKGLGVLGSLYSPAFVRGFGNDLKNDYTKAKKFVDDIIDNPQDVYINGEPQKPRLYSTKMTAGDYVDKETGNPIRHQDDIKGEVIDTTDNNNIVINAWEIPNLRVYNKVTKRFAPIRNLGSALARAFRPLWYFQTKVAPKLVAFNFRLIGSALRAVGTGVGRALGIVRSKVRDVFVGNEKEPRLYAKRIEAGHYRLKASGRIFFHQEDINGEVIDAEGNTLLAEDDLDKLNVYNNILRVYNPFKIVGWVAGKAKKAFQYILSKGFKASKFIFKTGASLITKGVKKVFNYLSKPGDVYVKGKDKPSLFGTLMAAGEYISSVTKKAIYSISEIDGPILDKEGNILLSEDELKYGIMDSKGNPIKPTLGSAIGKLLGKLNRAFSVRVALPGSRKPFNPKDLAKNPKATAEDKQTTAAIRQVSILEQIRDILSGRNNTKSGLTSSKTEDLMSEGTKPKRESLKSKLEQRKEKQDKLAQEKANKKSTGTTRLSSAADLRAKAAEAKKASLAKKAAAAGSTLGTAAKGAVAAEEVGLSVAGILGGIGSAIGGLLGLSKVLGLVGLGSGAAGAAGTAATVGATGAATAAAGAGTAATAAGLGTAAVGTAAAASGTGLFSTIAYGLGYGLTSIGSFFGAPVIIGAAAIAAGGFALYKGVKYFTRNSQSPLDKIRYVQYGFNKDNTEYANLIFKLEDYLSEFLIVEGSSVRINNDKLDLQEIMSIFDLNSKEQNEVSLFSNWFQGRFKSIYLTHLTATLAFTKKTDLDGADKLADANKKAFIETISFPDGPYSESALPILNPKAKATTASDVREVIKEVLSELKLNNTKSSTVVTETVGEATYTAMGDLSSPGVATEQTFEAKQSNQIKLPGSDFSFSSKVDLRSLNDKSKINALDAIRFKCYGLMDLDSSKVAALRDLEMMVSKSTKFSAGAVSNYTGNPIEILQNIAGSFGISSIVGKEANDWVMWFKERFLPVYLSYVSMYMNYTGKSDLSLGADLLKPNDQLNIAKLLGGTRSIWNQTKSPWPDYSLGTDPSTIKENINFLESVSKQTKLEEDKKSNNSSDSSVNNKLSTTTPSTDLGKGTRVENIKPSVVAGEGETVPAAGTTGQADSSEKQTPSTASGPLKDGAGGFGFLNLKPGVKLDRVNPTMLKLFYGMVEEYGTLTGKKVTVKDGFRTYEDQVAMKKAKGALAAEPGTSMHEYGLALDLDRDSLAEMESMGLMKKYGFTRPIGAEDWHVEPAGVQSNITQFKANRLDASRAIEIGIGRGGGGYGIADKANPGHRNFALATSLLKMDSTQVVDNSKTKEVIDSIVPVKMDSPPKPTAPVGTPTAPNASIPANKPTSAQEVMTYDALGNSTGLSSESETKPTVSTPSLGASNLAKAQNNLPADPTVQVPNPKGDGIEGMRDTITASAKLVGIDPNLALGIVAVESDFKASAGASTSSAKGLNQFTDGTWRETITKYGPKYGYNPATTTALDPKANAIMGAHYIKDSSNNLSRSINKDIGITEAYLSHFLGPSGASTFLKAMQNNPNALAADILPNAAASNKSIFYDGSRARTVSEVYTNIDKKVRDKAASYGIMLAPMTANVNPNTNNQRASNVPSLGSIPITSTTSAAPDTTSTAGAGSTYDTLGNLISPGTDNSAPTGPITKSIQSFNNSPLGDNYGINPNAARASASGVSDNSISKSMFTNTEALLTQSVSIQSQTLDVIKSIFGIMSAGGTSGSATTPAVPNVSPPAPGLPNPSRNLSPGKVTNEPYSPPAVPVPMRKSLV